MAPYQPILPVLTLLLLASTASGEALDPADESFRAASYAQAWAGPLNADHPWSNPASGHSGRVRATKERLDPASHQLCREIQEDIIAGERPATGYAVGCRGTDGSWRVIQSSAAAGAPASTGASSTIVPADVTPYVAPADINAAGSGGGNDLSSLPPQFRIQVPASRLPGGSGTGGSTTTVH